jgi:branched-chain amino acid transport system substrate-binding protein
MLERCIMAGLAAIAITGCARDAVAEDIIKIGLILPMTGAQQSTGKQIDAGVRLYMREHGDAVAGKKIEIMLKDDGAVPDVTKRLAQELIITGGVRIIAGFGVTPSAMAVAPLASQSKIPAVVMGAGSSILTELSPYIVRTSFAGAQSNFIIGEWAARNNIKSAVTIVPDFAPGIENETVFKDAFAKGGSRVVESMRFPLQNPDFAPFLQRAKDSKPDALFAFVLSGQGGTFLKQFVERGLDKSAIKLIGPGDVTDDDLLPTMSDAVLGTVTAHIYSAAHPSALNLAYVEAFKKANSGMRPNFMSVGGYDGMHLIYEALKRTNGAPNSDTLIEATKGMKWESPRGPIAIDAETRDIIQNVYVRRTEKVNGELFNVEFATFEAVKDPLKLSKK